MNTFKFVQLIVKWKGIITYIFFNWDNIPNAP